MTEELIQVDKLDYLDLQAIQVVACPSQAMTFLATLQLQSSSQQQNPWVEIKGTLMKFYKRMLDCCKQNQ